MIVPGRIEQVVSNLLENAFRYTPVDGSVEVCVRIGEGDVVVTTVKDSGPGIPEASLEKVFARFYTTERKDLLKEYGSGLGLAIAKSIIENHQGKMWVENNPDQGASFIFSLSTLSG
jgi:signal transduction histidine kinase